MTAEHIFYIPAVLALGVFIGMRMGRQAMVREIAERERDAREREQRRQTRRGADAGASSPDAP